MLMIAVDSEQNKCAIRAPDCRLMHARSFCILRASRSMCRLLPHPACHSLHVLLAAAPSVTLTRPMCCSLLHHVCQRTQRAPAPGRTCAPASPGAASRSQQLSAQKVAREDPVFSG